MSAKVIQFFLFLIVSFNVSSQVIIDTSLTNNCDEWHIKRGITVSRKLPETKFGPFETIETDKGRRNIINSNKEKSLEGSRGMLGIMKTTTTTESKPYTLTVLYNDKDSIFIDMLIITVSKNKHETIQFGKKEQPDENSYFTYCKETSIKIKNDTTHWNMSGTILRNESSNDSFEIKNAKGFKIGGKVRKAEWLWAAAGYVFLHGEKQVAAIQTNPEINVWLRKDLSEDYKQVLGGAIISFIIAKPFQINY